MTLPSVEMKQILAVLVILAILPSGHKSSPIPSQALHSGVQSAVAHGQQQVPYMVNQMQAMSNWLGRLHGLLTETALPPDIPAVTTSASPTNSTPKPHVTVDRLVQLAKQDSGHLWAENSHSTDETTWKEFEPSRLVVNTSNLTGGVIVASYGGHISKPSDMFRARFAVNGEALVTDGSEELGNFFVRAGDHEGQYRPFCFAQMFIISQRIEAKVELQTKLSQVNIRGGGAIVAAFPPPASLSTIKTDFEREDPLVKDLGPLHNINVTAATNALLIMTFNGLVESQEKGGSLSFEVDGDSPTVLRDDGTQVQRFGLYLNERYDGATNKAEFVSLTQLMIVEDGLHTVRVVGEGPLFDVSDATSQVMIIPTNSAQLHSSVPHSPNWDITTGAGAIETLLTVEFENKQGNNILVIAASFNAHAQCDDGLDGQSYYQINVNGKRVYPSTTNDKSQFGAWHEDRSGGTREARGVHGSMLAFAKISGDFNKPSIELIHRNTGQCEYITRGAILQVGAVPGNFTIDPIISTTVPVEADEAS